MTLVDQVIQGMGSSGLIGALSDLADADVVNDEQVWFGPSLEALWVGLVGKASV